MRWPEQATYVCTAGFAGVNMVQRAAVMPCWPSGLRRFAVMTVDWQAGWIYPHAEGTRPSIRATLGITIKP
jgi:hypothetical protein